MPKLGMTMPKFDMTGFGTKPERLTPAVPAVLSAAETHSLQSAVKAAFPSDWQVAFLSGNAGRMPDGTLAACGLVTAQGGGADGGSRTYIYRVGQDQTAGTGTGQPFVLRQIASRQGQQFVIYSDCSALKLM